MMTSDRKSDLQGLGRRLDRPSQYFICHRVAPRGEHDLRSQDASRSRDRSGHRRTAWLYEDLLN